MKFKSLMVLSLLLVTVACSKLTLENYNRITVGMSYDDVTTLIGPPEKCDDVMGVRNCLWSDGPRSVHVNFVADKALLFSSSNLR